MAYWNGIGLLKRNWTPCYAPGHAPSEQAALRHLPFFCYAVCMCSTPRQSVCHSLVRIFKLIITNDLECCLNVVSWKQISVAIRLSFVDDVTMMQRDVRSRDRIDQSGRSQRRSGARRSRATFNEAELVVLNAAFEHDRYPGYDTRCRLAASFNKDESAVMVCFHALHYK